MGSAFWHASHTYDGSRFDNNMIAVIAYIAHQASVSYFPASSILSELSETPRKKSGVEIAEDLVKMTYEKKVWEWSQVIDDADLPHEYFVTFSALVATTLSLLLPFWIV